jgi:ferric-dicitrate binding protein FerR (iron transport regulator)
VWLNAASSIRFPVTFAAHERKVFITGEAYFELNTVKSNDGKNIPFVVDVAGKEEVAVLGTHFNINAYPDETVIKTTLLEGKVKITAPANPGIEKILIPGEQSALYPDGKFLINRNADLEEAVAWKNGRFQFNSADLKSILRQLSRWYDVTIEYRGDTNLSFSGQLTRNENVYKVFEILELTGEVHFTVEGRKIIVTP